jgi:hypothetical protein
VKRPPVKNLPASVRQRLLNHARSHQRSFDEILQYYAIERFLYRLAQSSYGGRFVLKGALIFTAWGSPLSRPTRDVDLLGFAGSTVDSLTAIFKEICTQPVAPDGLLFDADSVAGEPIKAQTGYAGVRIRLLAHLDRARIALQLDVGFADAVLPKPRMLDYPTLLGMPAPRLRGYPREAVVAEKVHAMIALGIINSRMKDFYDLWVLARSFDFEGSVLLQSLVATFARRNTELRDEAPVALTDEFARARQAQWRGFLRTAKLAGVPQDFSAVQAELRAFLLPLLQAGARGEALAQSWSAPGPWQAGAGSEKESQV